MVASRSTVFLQRLSEWAPIRVAWYFLGIIATAVVIGALARLFIPPSPSPWHEPLTMIRNLLLSVALCVTYAVLVRRIELRPATELDIRKGSLAILIGSVIGSLLMSAVCLTLWALGMAQFSSGTALGGLVAAVVYNFTTATGEELLFRGVFFRIVEEVSGTAAAVGISAVVFGLMHLANPGVTVIGIAAVSMLGVFLALAYALTRNIWLAVGIHMAWNFTQGYVFGLAVSGTEHPFSILTTSIQGPALLTGGSFGPEASVFSLTATTLASFLLIALIVRNREWKAPRFQLRAPA